MGDSFVADRISEIVNTWAYARTARQQAMRKLRRRPQRELSDFI